MKKISKNRSDLLNKTYNLPQKTLVNRIPNKFLYYYFRAGVILRNATNYHFEKRIQTFWGDDFFIAMFEINTVSLMKTGCLREKEMPLIRYLIKNLSSCEVFYDIGANYGFYSSLASEIIDPENIYSFEPSRSIAKFLRKNISKKSEYIQAVVGNTSNTSINFYDAFAIGNSSISSPYRHNAKNSNFFYSVTVISIDSFVKKHNPPTFIKIDVEGYETEVIKGAIETLSKHSPAIAMELWKNSDNKEIVDILREFKYMPHILTIDGEKQSITWADIDRSITSNYSNLLFLKCELQ